MGATSRNVACPCGSGLKHKRCCLPTEQADREQALFEDAVGTRILRWTTECCADEVERAASEFGKSAAHMSAAEAEIFVTWLCADREMAIGATPSQRYAARADLDARERAVAGRIAEARLSLQRVRAVAAGRWIELEDVLRGSRVRVRSAAVSREAACWDVLLCRVVPDSRGASLWGPARFFAPGKEPELIAEVDRLAVAQGLAGGCDGSHAVFGPAALELMRFVPASLGVERSYFTAEGDPLSRCNASWSVTDEQAVFELLDAPPEFAWVGESEDGRGETFQWTVDRAQRVAGRRSLPPGALCFESSLSELPGRLCLATFELADGHLRCSAISEARLDAALELVADRLGILAKLQERTIAPFDRTHSGERATPREPPAGVSSSEAAEFARKLVDDHFRRWLDEPLTPLGGSTPREAARSSPRDNELELLLRGIENHAERVRRAGTAWPDVRWLREELGLVAAERAA